MARVTVRLYGEIAEKAHTTRYYMEADTVKDIFKQVIEKLPFLKKELDYHELLCLVNGVNINNLKGEDTKLEDFDVISLTLRRDGFILYYFPPKGKNGFKS